MKRWRSGKRPKGLRKKKKKPNTYRCNRLFGVCEKVVGGMHKARPYTTVQIDKNDAESDKKRGETAKLSEISIGV